MKKKIELSSDKFKLIVIFSITLSLALFFFIDHQPGIDQIRHISWAKSLNDSDHFLKLNLVLSSKNLIVNDEGGFLFNLFKTGYSDIGHLFNIFPILLLSALNFTNFFSVNIFNFVSILFFSFNTILALLIYREIFKTTSLSSNKIFNFFLIISLVPSYLFYYSTQGIHNISLFFLLSTILIIYGLEKSQSKKKLYILVLVSTLGIYSHKINLILIPCIICIYFLFIKNYSFFFKYIVFKGLVLTPVIIIFFFAPESFASTKKFSEIDISFFSYLINILAWLKNIYKNFGPFIFLFLIFGLFEVVKKKSKNKVILILISLHLLCYIFINSFSTYYIRTNLYLAHILIILSFLGFLRLIDVKIKFFKYLTLILFCVHLLWNLIPILNIQDKKFLNNDIYINYFYNNGKIVKSLNKINLLIKKDNKLIFFDDRIKDYFYVYQEEKYYKNSLEINTISNILNSNNELSENKINYLLHNKIILLSMADNHKNLKLKILEFNKKNKILSKNCRLNLRNIYKEKNIEFRNQTIFVDELNCEKLI